MSKRRWFFIKWENEYGKFSKMVREERKEKLVKEFESKGWKYKVKEGE